MAYGIVYPPTDQAALCLLYHLFVLLVLTLPATLALLQILFHLLFIAHSAEHDDRADPRNPARTPQETCPPEIPSLNVITQPSASKGSMITTQASLSA